VTGPRVLVALAAAVLVAGAVLELAVYRGGGGPQATTTAAAPFAVTATASGTTGFSETIVWTTPTPSTGTIRWGPAGTAPVLWTRSETDSASHTVTLGGLVPATAYQVEIDATSTGGETTSGTLAFTAPPAPGAVTSAVVRGALVVDGAPFFPLIAWEQCPDQWEPNIGQGIDLFAGNPCTGLPSLLAALQGRALAVGTSDDQPAQGPGLVGWFYPDEADGRGLTAATLPATPAGGVRFLTLSNHFYSLAAPLPDGKGIYPGLIARADVVGFDLYPLQEWCRPDLLGAVFDAQQQLVALAPGKPTFQWIEVREMQCPQLPVTQDDIRAESWLAIAGGAHGLGFFPADWGAQVGATIHGIATRVRELTPALEQPTLTVAVGPAGSPVRASARDLHGALYVIAVNPASVRAPVTLAQPLAGDRTFDVLGRARQVVAANGVISDVLPPLAVRVYVAPPG